MDDEIRKSILLEKKRHSLAKNKQYKLLLKTYECDFPSIPDLNTPLFWDIKNFKNKITPHKDHMTFDKLQTIIKLLKVKDKKILNIGLGGLDLERMILKNNKSLEWNGIDISSKSVITARKIFRHAKFNVGNIYSLNFKRNYFDYVLTVEVLEHIRPKKILKVLKDIKSILKKNGRFILSVPLNEGLPNLLKKNQNPNAHVRIYTPELIKAELQMSGFNVLFEKTFYAFRKNYKLKTFICKYFLKSYRKPNNILIMAGKK